MTKNFETIAEAKEYGVTLPNKYPRELVKIGNKPFMLCQTNHEYEGFFDNVAIHLLWNFGVILPETDDISHLSLSQTEEQTNHAALRDILIEAFEKAVGYSFLDAFDDGDRIIKAFEKTAREGGVL